MTGNRNSSCHMLLRRCVGSGSVATRRDSDGYPSLSDEVCLPSLNERGRRRKGSDEIAAHGARKCLRPYGRKKIGAGGEASIYWAGEGAWSVRAVCLLSGGLDSSTALAWALA